ncbi:hypothetical protein BD769DRAFT_1383801 [Suillus cothurnatus]|nr:hypothetical protein BD769DRAFT_1383801 [Suillus cothurnatus]
MSQFRLDTQQETCHSRTTIDSVSSAHQCTRAQTTAYLLGICPELPPDEVQANDEEVNHIDAVQHFYQGMADKPIYEHTAKQHWAPELDKTTMGIPDLYEHLGWRLSTAHRTDPPHQLLTMHDIDSAFKAARVGSSGRQSKKIAIKIINIKPTLKEKSRKENPQPLKRTYALYLDSDDESSDDKPPQNIMDTVMSVHSQYPAMNFLQFITHFDVGFYKEKIGMSEGAAYTFQSFVTKAYMKVECTKGRINAKGKRKA